MLPGQGNRPPSRAMFPDQAMPSRPEMPPEQAMMSPGPLMLPGLLMPPGPLMQPGPLMPPGQAMPSRPEMPPGRAVPPERAMMSPGPLMLPGQGMPPGRAVPPERAMMSPGPLMQPGQAMPPGQGMPPAGDRTYENAQLGLEPPGLVHRHRWVPHSSSRSSSAHPYRSNQSPSHLRYAHDFAPLEVSPVGFYRVILYPCLTEITSLSLLSRLSHILENFPLFEPMLSGKTYSFFVDQYNVAQRLVNQDNLITLSRRVRLRIRAEPKIPPFRMNANKNQAITSVLKSMLEENTITANLTKFYTNQYFTERNLLCSLNLPRVLGHVVDVLFSLAPDLVVLILDNNSLTSLEEAGMVLGKFTRLKVLSLAGNKISSFAELGHLSALNLDRLVLRDNSCTISLNRTDYENEVCAVLPTITHLDGQQILAFIRWDNPSPKLPVWKAGYFPEGGPIKRLSDFINRFLMLYDEMGRSNLTQVYHPQAVMSLACDLNGGSKWRLHDYVRYDRSLFISENQLFGNVNPLLFRGPEGIVSALKTLPDTGHYFEHMTFDVIEVSPNCAQIIISGLFKELNHAHNSRTAGKPFKHFHRCLIIEHSGNVLQIVNDSLLIRYPSSSQLCKLALIREERLHKLLIENFNGMVLHDGQ